MSLISAMMMMMMMKEPQMRMNQNKMKTSEWSHLLPLSSTFK